MSLPHHPVHVIGAGIAGLILARSLSSQGHDVILYDKAANPPAHNYGITLHSWSYHNLISLLNIDETTLKRTLSADGAIGGIGNVFPDITRETSLLASTEPSVRVNSGKLRRALAEGLNIKRGYELQTVTPTPSGHKLIFGNGEEVDCDGFVAADGMLSQVRARMLTCSPSILPYTTFSGGRRRVNAKDFREIYSPHFGTGNVLQQVLRGIYLRIAVIERCQDHVDIGYIFSRPTRAENDPLHPTSHAQDETHVIPEEFYLEVQELFPHLLTPFKETFHVDHMRRDRVVHWFMRNLEMRYEDLAHLAECKIAIIGDAAHGTCILGGMGGNVAIIDATSLAQHIEGHGFENLKSYYVARYPDWQDEEKQSIINIARRHGQKLDDWADGRNL